MELADDIYTLPMHGIIKLTSKDSQNNEYEWMVMRVPSGWIYTNPVGQMVFIPLTLY